MNKDKYFKEYEGIEAFSVQQISFMLQLPFSMVAKYCKDGILPCFKIGIHYRVMKADLVSFIDEGIANSTLKLL